MRKFKVLIFALISTSLLFACGNNNAISNQAINDDEQNAYSMSEEDMDNSQNEDISTDENHKDAEELDETDENKKPESTESLEDIAKANMSELKEATSFNLDEVIYENDQETSFQLTYRSSATNEDTVNYFTSFFENAKDYTVESFEDVGIIATNIKCIMFDVHEVEVYIKATVEGQVTVNVLDHIDMNLAEANDNSVSNDHSQMSFTPSVDFTELCFYKSEEVLDDIYHEVGYSNRYFSKADYQEIYDFYYANLEKYEIVELYEQTDPYPVNTIRVAINENEYISVNLSYADADALPLVKFNYEYSFKEN
jgi:hypothetical protein